VDDIRQLGEDGGEPRDAGLKPFSHEAIPNHVANGSTARRSRKELVCVKDELAGPGGQWFLHFYLGPINLVQAGTATVFLRPPSIFHLPDPRNQGKKALKQSMTNSQDSP
jgi:hypothetical protein